MARLQQDLTLSKPVGPILLYDPQEPFGSESDGTVLDDLEKPSIHLYERRPQAHEALLIHVG